MTAVAITALLATTLVVAGPARDASAQGTDAQCLQFGQVIDLNTCQLTTPINLFFNDPGLVAQTNWIRIDLRAAGGASPTGCDATFAYHNLLARIANEAQHIKVIGLLSNDFILGGGLDVGPRLFGSQAGVVACSPG
ncbi:hypothetical protein O7623_14590 [Solwaraspora sp. WMMD791]|uniref:hypothetical protein n=1 Tax=Solwaraspora sp. WMMD791 TaxID=3016086 RepID=UPI00249AD4A5|nr:hypothetical protein [Solwaraspora sp. WMMD791]WFE30332.1 hypothetical protein O7623_14590 [Solwaraspora sp. WMMD791]